MRNSISIDIHVEPKPEIKIEAKRPTIEVQAEEKPSLDISVKHTQVITYYDLIFEEL